jgi:signal transduction histidine kinase
VSNPVTTKNKQGRFGLSARLLVLTILFGLLAEVMVYLPSVATYRQNWLSNRISSAITAALVLEAAPNGMVSDNLAMEILDSVGAKMVALKMSDTKRLLASSEMPPQVATTTDIRNTSELMSIREAIATLLAPPGRFIRVVGDAPMHGQFVEIVIDEAPLKQAMYGFSGRLLLISLIISAITACLVYLTLSWVIVRPMRRLTSAMMDFGANPEDESRVVRTSNRSDEIGAAERELAAMQRQLIGMLQQKSRLAALGLAVSKINHDLRNLLASSQLLSDQLASVPDPRVQRFAPKLMRSLERAIAFCQSTLSYGRAQEAAPDRRMIPIEPVVAEVRETAGLASDATITWVTAIERGLSVDADPDQLFRVLLNLVRNAAQALEAHPKNDPASMQIRVTGRREGAVAILEVSDTGPGVPAKARDHLFEAFRSSSRPGGSGLGLAIAAELVRAHDGDIHLVEGTLGATFRIVIPDRPVELLSVRNERARA